jgi:penicillin-binding protein 1A
LLNFLIKTFKNKRWYRRKQLQKYILGFWALIFIGGHVFFILFFFIAKGKLGEMPSFEQRRTRKVLLLRKMIAVKCRGIGRYFREKQDVRYIRAVPEDMINASSQRKMSASTAFRHRLACLFRVLIGNLTGDMQFGRGSTISQQLAKMLSRGNNLRTNWTGNAEIQRMGNCQ